MNSYVLRVSSRCGNQIMQDIVFLLGHVDLKG
jgi:hypothetical protein